MARLRHFAVVVRDLEKSAKFYEDVFGLKKVGQEKLDFAAAVYLSDGVINLALLNYFGKRGSGLDDAKNFVGAHHFGFQVDDLAAAQDLQAHRRRRAAADGRLAGARVRADRLHEVVDPIGGVHQVDFGNTTKHLRNWPFKGTFHDFVIWPADSRGIPLTFRLTVKVGNVKRVISYPVTAR